MSKVKSQKSKVDSAFNVQRLTFKIILFLLSFVFCQNIQAQSPDTLSNCHPDTISIRPRVGVVLSGGGAKGFAHIGALKVIEEAGLPIDYIAGTSMGSIIGGLYAIGYDLETLTQLTKEQNWDAVMADVVPRKYISVDDKILDRHYLVTFPFRNRKIQMKSSIYDGEMINLLLARLTSPAYNIRNFNELPIPFLCIATDIENAEAYEMTKGNLQRAIRASMSIPFYFPPIEIDNRLLIDGGIRNNFPVHNLREKGLDIIIGVNVQRDYHEKEDLNSLTKLLDQMIAITDVDANKQAMEEVDIHIKPQLSDYGMMDFNFFDTIISLGEKTAREYLPQLKHLADSIRSIQDYSTERNNVVPIDSLYVVSLKIDGVSDENANFIRNSFSKHYPNIMTINEIEMSIMRIYATGYYSEIWYELLPEPKGVSLLLHCKEKEEETVSIAAHYDTDYGIGILANITLKNVIVFPKRSTLSLDINIAENPYFKLRFHSNMSQKFKYGSDISAMSLFMNQYNDKTINNSYSVQDNKLDLFIEYTPNLKRQFRLGVVGNYVHLRDNLVHIVKSDNYDFIAYTYLNYHIDNEDSPSFASRGWKLNLNGKYLIPFINMDDTHSTSMSHSIIINANFNGSIAIGRRHSLKFSALAGASFTNNDIPLSYRFFVGGQSQMNYFDNIISFEGLRFTQLYGNNVAIGKISWQYNFYKDLYAIANINCGFISDIQSEWFTHDKIITGAGLTLGINTMAGPIEVSVMGSNRCSNLIGFLNVGFWF